MKSKIMLLVCAVFLTVFACTKKSSSPNTNVTPATMEKPDFSKYALMGLDSPFLRPDSANIMIASYLASRQNTTDLKALIVDGDALRYYLNNSDVKYVKLMFAHKKSYINSSNHGVPCGMNGNALTIVIAGFDEDNNYIYSPQGAVMDFCTPCPALCPENGTAQYDLLPTQSQQ